MVGRITVFALIWVILPMSSRIPLLLISSLIFLSCNKYRAYKSQYAFNSPDGLPDYGNLDFWAAHPWKKDPSDSIPKPLRNGIVDSTVDVFFLHPTTFTGKKQKKVSNASIDDWYINAKTDYSTILYQASVFNEECRVFAPRYRQAHIRNFYIKDTSVANEAFRKAYVDIKNAFAYYLEHFNNGRPIIIAAHSQGSLHAQLLLKDFFADGMLKNRLVVAYLTGWPVYKDSPGPLRICSDSLQTGCLCSWRTFRKGYMPSYVKKENGNAYATNPLSWTTNGDYIPHNMNKGSVLTAFNKVYEHTSDARVDNGVVHITKPKFPGSFMYFTKNYHIGDINLFYINIRENVRQRIGVFWKQVKAKN